MPTLNVQGSTIYYARAGEGVPALVFVHGAGADHTLWGDQLKTLSGEFTVAAIDLNGHGRSPRRADVGIPSYVEDVRALCEALGLPIVLVGHSMGGAVALTLALAPPTNLKALALVGTGAKLKVHPHLLDRCRNDFAGALDLIATWAFAPQAPEELRQRSKTQMERNGAETLLRDFSSCNEFDVLGRLHEIRLPTLVLCGRDDQLTPPKYSEFLQKNIPHARLVLIERAGHMPMLEQPQALAEALRAFCIELRSSLE
ncbi:MAG: alpha/beta hydrolase [Candidatus Bipolaricaulota bacterium]|nr:alpha/beta hydrolase [Candidatus Bipolaricaulota bacterium]MCS7273903.1 alpha/beta hydrolase [Candidatus Bipolaricaulota bacterium]MDW8110811.1 alpha/beta hydrolase [Candidatus Bipolaricaulota bacterium]MDW8328708.1 alpha/beta hydrolase [Candidatus Bipolaricaulota bacterium]